MDDTAAHLCTELPVFLCQLQSLKHLQVYWSLRLATQQISGAIAALLLLHCVHLACIGMCMCLGKLGILTKVWPNML